MPSKPLRMPVDPPAPSAACCHTYSHTYFPIFGHEGSLPKRSGQERGFFHLHRRGISLYLNCRLAWPSKPVKVAILALVKTGPEQNC
jgi:hypothetical protein